MSTLRPGDQLASTACAARVVVVRARGSVELCCGGSPMVPAAGVESAAENSAEPVTLIGKRYVDANETVELLCTVSGSGGLSCDGVPMTVKAAKALPASD
ncbi:MAG TPA: hypothetical protein VG756_32765 [Pseudonocardiaceae bacterium]|jgi:hypothetical protein|nr:hypothetical protein [Pseudonocardiaceae bacterium]